MCTWQCRKQALLYSVFYRKIKTTNPQANHNTHGRLVHTTPAADAPQPALYIKIHRGISLHTTLSALWWHCNHTVASVHHRRHHQARACAISIASSPTHRAPLAPSLLPLPIASHHSHWPILQSQRIEGIYNQYWWPSVHGRRCQGYRCSVCPRRNCLITNLYHSCRLHSLPLSIDGST